VDRPEPTGEPSNLRFLIASACLFGGPRRRLGRLKVHGMSRVEQARHGACSSHYPIRRPVSMVLSRTHGPARSPLGGRIGVAWTHLDFARGARVAGLPESSFGVGCTGRAADVVRTMGSAGAGVVFRVYRVFSRSLSGREGSERVGISGVAVGIRRVAMLLQRRRWIRAVRHLVGSVGAYDYCGTR